MINWKDVRIGNLVEYDGRIFAINSIDEIFPTLNTDEFGIGVVDWNNINPIPLEEKWLPHFGFKRDMNDLRYGYRYYYGINDFRYVVEKDFNEYPSNFFGIEYTDSPRKADDGEIYTFSFDLKYVHQLQNLFYSLEHTELETMNT
jgi:hypothetical protein